MCMISCSGYTGNNENAILQNALQFFPIKSQFLILLNILVVVFISNSTVDDGSVLHTGEATFYGDGGGGNCGFGDQQPLYHGAMNHLDYDSAAACGSWVHITGPKGEVTAFIDDRCPECLKGDIDLGPGTFEMIAEKHLGRVPIQWRYVEGPASGPIEYYWQTGSSRWHIAVQIRNHIYGITKVEIRNDRSEWVNMQRSFDNFFVLPGGVNKGEPGPYTIRVTNIFGHQLADSGLTILEGESVKGSINFQSKTIVRQNLKKNKPDENHILSVFLGNGSSIPKNFTGLYDLYTISGRKIADLKTPAEIKRFLKSQPIKGMTIIRKILPDISDIKVSEKKSPGN